MMKYLILAVILFLAYRVFFTKKNISSRDTDRIEKDEFQEYEEIE